MRILLKDSVVAPYEEMAAQQGRSVDQVIESQLNRFKMLPPGQKAIVVNVADAERILGGTPVLNGTDLLSRVARLASLSFHAIKLDFSPAQLAELQHRAERQGKSVEQLAQEIVTTITRDFFWVASGAAAEKK